MVPFVETLVQVTIDAAEPIVVRGHSLAGDRLIELQTELSLAMTGKSMASLSNRGQSCV